MNIKIELIYLIFILTLNFSCSENKKSVKGADNSEFVRTLENDTLKFTSGIRAIFQDSKGNYWFGSHNEGVCNYDGKTFKYYTTNDGLQDNQIRSIQEDKNGIIWIVTARGVNSYHGGKLTSYTTEFNSPKLDWNTTTGNLWFYAGEEDGINRFDGINMNYLVFPKPDNIDPYNSFGVTGISTDKEERVWIATYSALFSYDGELVDVFGHEKLNLEENEQIHIRSVLADSKGRIWIGNNGIGVILKSGDSTIHFSKEKGKLIPMQEFKSNTQNGHTTKNIGLQSVFAIEEDNEGNIWFADRDSGVWKYNGESLTNFTIDEKLKSQMVWDIYLDKNKTLLFGMADGGVYKFNGQSFDKRF
ncbi:two-component regulator propeller domain-containing protein [Maribacter sp. LLG6340-A2]|uniref:ligand-binding sensor domain-containing protein n=1 Tax=Maribacter sp. LLG6340-A2 TaxID=3160834 RepID=UPI0038709282